MTEVNEVTVEEVTFTATAGDDKFTGFAEELNDLVTQVVIARDAAVELVSGLAKKSDINKAALTCRNALQVLKESAFAYRKTVTEIKEDLLENVGEVQAAAKKEALLEQQRKIAEQLAKLEG